MNIPTKACIAGSFSAVLLSYSSFAAQDEHLTILVTGTRTAQTVDESLAPVTVIDREQIEQSSATSINDLLQATPGLSLSVNGAQGSATSIFLRGTNSDQVLVLIDGVRMSSATTGTASIQNIPLHQIERIEIVRGPRSSLYGSDAIGGVIQIFTRKPQAGTQATFGVKAGSHSSRGLDAGFSGRKEKSWFSAQASTFETDGFNACRAEAATAFGGCFTDEPDQDGYKNQAISLSGGMQLSERLNARVNLLNIDSDLDFDGSFSNRQESTNQLISTKLDFSARENWNIAFTAARNEDHTDNYNNEDFSSRFDTDRDQFGIQNDIYASESGIATFGIDYFNDKVSGTTQYSVSERDNTGIYAQYQGQMSGGGYLISLRNDNNEQFGNKATGGLSFGKDISDTLRWTAAYGTAFKAPSFNELFFPGFGNAALNAETSKSADIGLSGKHAKGGFSINIFNTRIDDLIAFDATLNQPVNEEEARIKGIEANTSWQINQWNINLALSFLDPKIAGQGTNSGKYLARRPRQKADVTFFRQFQFFNAGVQIHNQGSSFDDSANTKRLDGFTTVGLKLNKQLFTDWRLELALKNLFDKRYETAQFFNQDGINGLLSLRYSPK